VVARASQGADFGWCGTVRRRGCAHEIQGGILRNVPLNPAQFTLGLRSRLHTPRCPSALPRFPRLTVERLPFMALIPLDICCSSHSGYANLVRFQKEDRPSEVSLFQAFEADPSRVEEPPAQLFVPAIASMWVVGDKKGIQNMYAADHVTHQQVGWTK
jgi:hypothetical protein